MGQNSYNLENAERLKKARETAESIPQMMKKGAQGAVEMAAEVGSPKYIQDAQELQQGVEQLNKTAEEFLDAIAALQKTYDDMAAITG